MLRPANQMLPHEILEAREHSSCAFVPVSPVFEWHSFHLPMGTDALIAEGMAAAVAERVGGIYFPPLSFGLDEYRPKDQLLAWGFKKNDKVFGMRFPELPLSSEYCSVPEMSMAISNRLDTIRHSGFKFAFLVNNHGGAGQFDLLNDMAIMSSNPPVFHVFSVTPYQFITPIHEHMKTGGHAGLSETLNLMAFRPELVDLTQLPEGELNVRLHGILHHEPTIGAEFNPRQVMLSTANEIRKMIVEGFAKFVEKQTATTKITKATKSTKKSKRRQ
jgi:creatinine amidohydrolase/Fe(II)-dependent formamide hydrolase-like protein